jgi:hypothetical protein
MLLRMIASESEVASEYGDMVYGDMVELSFAPAIRQKGEPYVPRLKKHLGLRTIC